MAQAVLFQQVALFIGVFALLVLAKRALLIFSSQRRLLDFCLRECLQFLALKWVVQGEVGSACAMAAAGWPLLTGALLEQIENARSENWYGSHNSD